MQRLVSSSRASGASGVAATAMQRAALQCARRFAGTNLLASGMETRLGRTSGLSKHIHDGNRDKALLHNKEIMNTLSEQMSQTEIQFRKEDRPWEIVPQFVRRRVTDLVGILKTEHRMEMEQAIEKILPICDIDLYVVIVPTVGFCEPRVFAQSLLFDWKVGEPRGNGVLIVISQGEANVQVVSSPAVERYFGQEFCDLLVADILQPAIKEKGASYAILQTTYAIARHAQEARHLWQSDVLSLPTRNRLLFGKKVLEYGVFRSWSLYWAIVGAGVTGMLWSWVVDLMCPECGALMCKVEDEETIAGMLNPGQRIEWRNGCTQFRVQKCGKAGCGGQDVTVLLRDMYNEAHCQKCDDCHFYTVSMTSEIKKLPTKTEDGYKEMLYTCEHCRVGREMHLPLFRPLDDKPDGPWFDFLLDRAAKAKPDQNQLKTLSSKHKLSGPVT
jgi:uncharacterized membrane protein YgcG